MNKLSRSTKKFDEYVVQKRIDCYVATTLLISVLAALATQLF